jgi:hypothetical protein
MSRTAIDLPILDRDVRRAASRVERLRAWLAKGTPEAREKARTFDPWDGIRHTAVQATYRSLIDLEPSILDVPLRDGLLRWVHELLQVRIGHELAADDADAVHLVDPRLPAGQVAARTTATTATAIAATGADEVESDTRDGAQYTYGEALKAIATAPDAGHAAAALVRAGELAAPVAAVRKERRERRFEISRRLGLAHPFALATTSDVGAAAQSLLDATEPLAIELLKVARKKSEGPWHASSAIQLALGRDANKGWPSHLNARWLDESFKALAPRGVDPGPLPEATSGASFLRAAASWGFAWRISGTPRQMPFGLARDPYPAPAFRFAFAMAALVAEPAFQRRGLELAARAASVQSRVLRTTMFFYARTIAARALLASQETVAPAAFEEIGARLLGAPLPAAMRDAWPDPRITDASQLVGLLGTRAFMRDLVERYDEDWFRNPKAGTHLTSLACGPAFDADPIAPAAPATLARAFEEALG